MNETRNDKTYPIAFVLLNWFFGFYNNTWTPLFSVYADVKFSTIPAPPWTSTTQSDEAIICIAKTWASRATYATIFRQACKLSFKKSGNQIKKHWHLMTFPFLATLLLKKYVQVRYNFLTHGSLPTLPLLQSVTLPKWSARGKIPTLEHFFDRILNLNHYFEFFALKFEVEWRGASGERTMNT